MPTTMSTQAVPQLPKLGWWADLDVENDSLSVLHGTSVEVGEGFLVEGVWDGDFSLGEFHKSEAFFGSGIRLQDGDVYFVASSAPVDRLFFGEHGGHVFASNSLLIMLAQIDASLVPDLDYRRETRFMIEGIDGENDKFPVQHEHLEYLRQFAGKNAVISNGRADYRRRDTVRSFDNYEHYFAELNSAIARIGDNYTDPSRTTRIRPFGTLTTGYDSPAVTCVTKKIGVKECFTYTGSWSEQSTNDPALDATKVAAALGVETISLNASQIKSSVDEQFMHAASSLGAQTNLLPLAAYIESHCDSALLFTGYSGGNVWGAKLKPSAIGRDLKRRDVSGLDLSELRLKSGFVNVPVPFIFSANLESIYAITRSEEMAPWRLNNAYDRPIPRRMLEESGVDRELFGMTKAAVFTRRSRPATESLRTDFETYLRREQGIGNGYVYFRLVVDRATAMVLTSLLKLYLKVEFLRPRRPRVRRTYDYLVEGKSPLGFRVNFRSLLYKWSVASTVERIKGGALYPDR